MQLVSAVPSPPGRIFVRRLHFAMTAKDDYDVGALCRLVADNPDRALFFCDTSLFDDRTDHRLFSALLNEEGKLVIVPPVQRELEPWLATHQDHPAARAIIARDPAIQFFTLDNSGGWEDAAAEYYVKLLGIRKRLLRLELAKFEEKHGRPPDAGELDRLHRDMHRALGPRGYLLARKGAETLPAPISYTDEILVYLAVATGISSGRPVVILSKDEDLQEQFYKLQWLLDTQYRGMLLADLYRANFSRFVFHPLPGDNRDLAEAFVGQNNVLIERSEDLLDEILPTSSVFVPLYCWIVGDKLTQTLFGAEREMTRLLRVKGETGGLNTDRLAGRNCHISLAPMDVPVPLEGCAAIVQDRRGKLPSSRVEIPFLDVQQVAYCAEGFKRNVEVPLELSDLSRLRLHRGR